MRLSHSYLKKIATEPIKKEGRYVNGKLKTWKERIRTHVKDCKYIDAENQQCSMLSDDDDDDGFFEV